MRRQHDQPLHVLCQPHPQVLVRASHSGVMRQLSQYSLAHLGHQGSLHQVLQPVANESREALEVEQA
eukprot:1658542-Lingulodinium_polyedra.AAC.1